MLLTIFPLREAPDLCDPSELKALERHALSPVARTPSTVTREPCPLWCDGESAWPHRPPPSPGVCRPPRDCCRVDRVAARSARLAALRRGRLRRHPGGARFLVLCSLPRPARLVRALAAPLPPRAGVSARVVTAVFGAPPGAVSRLPRRGPLSVALHPGRVAPAGAASSVAPVRAPLVPPPPRPVYARCSHPEPPAASLTSHSPPRCTSSPAVPASPRLSALPLLTLLSPARLYVFPAVFTFLVVRPLRFRPCAGALPLIPSSSPPTLLPPARSSSLLPVLLISSIPSSGPLPRSPLSPTPP